MRVPQDREYELKFSIASDAAARLTHHPALEAIAGTPQRQRLVSTYFDTAAGALRRRRVTLRVRESGRRTVQTLKRSGHSLVDRNEWECEGGATPDLAWLRSTPLAELFADETIAATLDRRFTVDVDRTVIPITFEGTTIEGAIDKGAILAGGLSLPVHEVELEHKDGPSDGVVRLVRKLARDLPLVLSLSSKAERGFAVADASWGHPTKEISLDLSNVKTLRDLFTAVLQGCLHTLCRNAALIGHADDGEAVHKTRIALRHIRAALSLFRPVLRRKASARLGREIKWMSDRLGAARDGDVFRLMTERATSTPFLANALEPRRRRAHKRLQAAVASARWRLLLIDLLAFSKDGLRRSRQERRAAPFIRRRIRKLRSDLAYDARGLRHVPAEALHDLRKRAKMLRYDLDLLTGLPRLGIRPKHFRQGSKDLSVLQDALGAIHDAEALGERLQESVLSRHAPTKGVSEGEWSSMVRDARTLHRPAIDPAHLDEAAKAARRLRKRAF